MQSISDTSRVLGPELCSLFCFAFFSHAVYFKFGPSVSHEIIVLCNVRLISCICICICPENYWTCLYVGFFDVSI